MPKLKIPSTPEDITPQWLTEALRSTNTITDIRVKSVTVEPLVEGQGNTTQLARLKVDSLVKTRFEEVPAI